MTPRRAGDAGGARRRRAPRDGRRGRSPRAPRRAAGDEGSSPRSWWPSTPDDGRSTARARTRCRTPPPIAVSSTPPGSPCSWPCSPPVTCCRRATPRPARTRCRTKPTTTSTPRPALAEDEDAHHLDAHEDAAADCGELDAAGELAPARGCRLATPTSTSTPPGSPTTPRPARTRCRTGSRWSSTPPRRPGRRRGPRRAPLAHEDAAAGDARRRRGRRGRGRDRGDAAAGR